MNTRTSAVLFAVIGASMVACSPPANPDTCSLTAMESGCRNGLVCEPVRGAMPKCFAPINVSGRVFDLTSSAAIAGARVVVLDANGSAASNVAVSDAMGNYSVRVPSERDAMGNPTQTSYTLRADAQNYQSFPSGLRPSLPVDVMMSMATDAGTNITNATTEIGLIPLAAGMRATISGAVEGTNNAGVLVVGGGSTAVSDKSGRYVLFNVTPGAVTVRGYASGVQLEPAMANVAAGATAENVNLRVSSTALSTVSGSVQIVNGGGASSTSVVLVVRETFNMALERGEVPRGLRAGNVTGAFTIEGVPDGEYWVLAAYENDGLVRDPDPGISGTQLVSITVPMGASRAVMLPTSFKVTGALAVRSPGAERPEMVTGNPMLRWADDSSEDGYEVRVFDAFGTMVWERTDLPSVSGGGEVSVTYAGPALTPGMYYQFRATSFRTRGGGGMRAPISRTEDLRGLFFAGR